MSGRDVLLERAGLIELFAAWATSVARREQRIAAALSELDARTVLADATATTRSPNVNVGQALLDVAVRAELLRDAAVVRQEREDLAAVANPWRWRIGSARPSSPITTPRQKGAIE